MSLGKVKDKVWGRRGALGAALFSVAALEGTYGCVGETDTEEFIEENVGEVSDALGCDYYTITISPAQVFPPGSQPGVFGGINPVCRGTVAYARLTPQAGGAPTLTVALNGLPNYSLYYSAAPAGNGPARSATVDQFLPGGTYMVTYLDENQQTVTGNCALNSCTVTYSPTTTVGASYYTQGVQVPGQAQNPPPFAGPPGIQGIVTQNGSPVVDATMQLLSNNIVIGQIRTNGAGFYNFYYEGGVIKKPIEPGVYSVRAITPHWTSTASNVSYAPTQVSNPNNVDYYITGAQVYRSFTYTGCP